MMYLLPRRKYSLDESHNPHRKSRYLLGWKTNGVLQGVSG